MAKARRAPFEADDVYRYDLGGKGLTRCAWCGMLPSSSDLVTLQTSGLCAECSRFLEGVEWKKLLIPQGS